MGLNVHTPFCTPNTKLVLLYTLHTQLAMYALHSIYKCFLFYDVCMYFPSVAVTIIISHFYARGICVDPQPHQIVVSRNFQKLDIDKLDKLLSCDDIWDEVFSSFDDVSDCLECFNLIMKGLLDLLAPLRKLRVRWQECPWLSNASLSTACRLRDVAHRRALRSGSASDWTSYRKLQNKVNAMLRSAKADYFTNLASSSKSKPAWFWKHFQSLSRRSRSVCGSQVVATANDFNDYFLLIPYKTVANVSYCMCLLYVCSGLH